jgi:hypothetical protein
MNFLRFPFSWRYPPTHLPIRPQLYLRFVVYNLFKLMQCFHWKIYLRFPFPLYRYTGLNID